MGSEMCIRDSYSNIVHMLHETSQRVVVRRDEDAFPPPHRRHNIIDPVRQDPFLAHPQRFSGRQGVGPQMLIAPVPPRPEGVVRPHADRFLVEAAPELLEQFLALRGTTRSRVVSLS